MGEAVGSPVEVETRRSTVRWASVAAILFFIFGWGVKGCYMRPSYSGPSLSYFDMGEDQGAKMVFRGEVYYALLVAKKDDWVDSDGNTVPKTTWSGADQSLLNKTYFKLVRRRRAVKLIKAGNK